MFGAEQEGSRAGAAPRREMRAGLRCLIDTFQSPVKQASRVIHRYHAERLATSVGDTSLSNRQQYICLVQTPNLKLLNLLVLSGSRDNPPLGTINFEKSSPSRS
jgi:hypothetical protein